MKIYVNECGEIELEDVFNAIVVKTPAGRYGICQRDGDIEIVRNSKCVFSGAELARDDIEKPEQTIERLRDELAAERTAHTATREELRQTIRAADTFGI